MKLVRSVLAVMLGCFVSSQSAVAGVTNIVHAGYYQHVRDAVAAAHDGDVLLVSTGVYVPDWICVSNKMLQILGGYASDFSRQLGLQTAIRGNDYAALVWGGTALFERLMFTTAGAGYGVGIQIERQSVVTCLHCVVHGNTNAYGAGIRVSSSKLVFAQGRVTENAAVGAHPGWGGGLYVDNGQVSVEGDTLIASNSAARCGGGIYVTNTRASVTVTGGAHVRANVALLGGGCAVQGSASVRVTGGASVSGNTATDSGGGVFVVNGQLTVDGPSTRLGNVDEADGANVATNDGGHVYAVDSTVILSNFASCVRGEAKRYGGGIYISNGTLVVRGHAQLGMLASNVWNMGVQGGGNVCAIGSYVEATEGAGLCRGGSMVVGGGLYARDSELLFADAYVLSNECLITGGGIAFGKSVRAVLTNVVFGGNYAGEGGAVGVVPGTVGIDASFTDCTISNNRAVTSGGGIFWDCAGTLQFHRCELVHNAAQWHGGGLATLGSRSQVAFRTGQIKGNQAGRDGGGWYLGGGIKALVEGAVHMVENHAGYDGGALALSNATLVARGSNEHWVVCNDNHADGNGGACAVRRLAELYAQGMICRRNISRNRGGAVDALLGTVQVIPALPPDGSFLPANEWSGNAANAGGALAAEDSTVFLDSIAVFTNRGNVGGAVYLCGQAAAMLINTVIVSNYSSNARDGLYVDEDAQCTLVHATCAGSTNCVFVGGEAQVVATNSIFWSWGPPVVLFGNATADICYCDVRGGWPGQGNFNADPLFVAPTQMNYQVLISSPCVNTGISAGVDVDCLGRTRPIGDNYDLGAYECVPEPGWMATLVALGCVTLRWRKARFTR